MQAEEQLDLVQVLAWLAEGRANGSNLTALITSPTKHGGPYDFDAVFLTDISSHLAPLQTLMIMASQAEESIEELLQRLAADGAVLDPNNINRMTILRFLFGAWLADIYMEPVAEKNFARKLLEERLKLAGQALTWQPVGATVHKVELVKCSYYHFEGIITHEGERNWQTELIFRMPGKTHVATYTTYPTLEEAKGGAYVLLIKWLSLLVGDFIRAIL